MKKFADTHKDLTDKKEIKEKAANMARDFVVLVAYSNYDAKANGFNTKYENVNVLVGP